jgi:hypothetical protein
MAWLTNYGATNKIVDSEREDIIRMSSFGVTPAVSYDRTITETDYRYVGMDYATAQACLADMAANQPTFPSMRQATLQNENNGGGYTVRVSETEYGDWTVVVPP